MSRSPWKLVFAIYVAAVSGQGLPALAEVHLPHIFGDNMVLQYDRPIPVWGWAARGEEVTVSLAGETRTAKAGDDGRWKVVLPHLPRMARWNWRSRAPRAVAESSRMCFWARSGSARGSRTWTCRSAI